MARLKAQKSSSYATFQSLFFLTNYLLFMFSFIKGAASQATSAITVDLNKLTPDEGIILTGSSGTGRAMDFADFNNDNQTDGLFGASASNTVYMPFSPFVITNLQNLNGTFGRVFYGATGTGVAVRAGFLNNDTSVDFVVGTLTNKTYFVYGPDFPITNLDELTEPYGKIVYGNSSTGTAIDIKDVNLDGNNDVGIGDFNVNTIYIVLGPNFSTDLKSLNGTNGYIVKGASNFGISLVIANMTKDKWPDLLAGAPGAGTVSLCEGPTFVSCKIFTSQNIVTGSSVFAADLYNTGNNGFLTDSREVGILHWVSGEYSFNQTNLDVLNGTVGENFVGKLGTGFPPLVIDYNGDGRKDIITSSLDNCFVYGVLGSNFVAAKYLDQLTPEQGFFVTGACGWALQGYYFNSSNCPALVIGSQLNNSIYIIFNEVYNIFQSNCAPAMSTNIPTTSATLSISSTLSNGSSALPLISTTSVSDTTTSVFLKLSTTDTSKTQGATATITTNLPNTGNNDSTIPISIAAVSACPAGGLITAFGIFAFKKCRPEKIDYSNDAAMKELECNSLPRLRTNQYQSAIFPVPMNTKVPIVYSTLGEISASPKL